MKFSVFFASVMMLLLMSGAMAVSEFSISGFSEWDSSTVNSFNANITGYPYLIPYTAAEYLFEWNTDDSISSNNGALSGYTLNNGTISGATTGVTGVYGEGVSFDGVNDYIEVSDMDLNVSTICSWVKPYGSSDATYGMLFDDGSNSYQLYMYQTGGTWYWRYRANGLSDNTIFSKTVTFNSWQHICSGYNGTHIFLCKDGNCNYESSSGSITTNNNDLSLGADKINSRFYINASFDEGRIWNNTGLSQSEIQTEMNSHFPVETPVLSYSFEAYNATHVFDTNWNTQGQDEAETGAISFDGSQYVTTSDLDLNVSTICFWANPYDLYGTYNHIIYKTTSSYEIYAYQTGGSWYWRYRASGLSDNTIFSQTAIEGIWQHVCAGYNGTAIFLCKNGNCNYESSSGSIGNVADVMGIGADTTNNRYYYNGSLSEVQIYNRALSADEVGYLYDSQAITYALSTSDGKLETQIPNSSPNTYNISVQATDYFPQSFSQNLGLNLSVYFNQSEISFDSFEKFTNKTLNSTYRLLNRSGYWYDEGSDITTTTISTTSIRGMTIELGVDKPRLKNVTIDATSLVTRAFLYDDGLNLLETTTNLSGDVFYFANEQILDYNNITIAFDGGGASVAHSYNNGGASYPYNFAHSDWIAGYNAGTAETTRAYDLISVGFTSKELLNISEAETINLPAANGYQAISQVNDYYNKTFSFDVVALDTKTVDVLNIFDVLLYIVFKDVDNTTITNSTVINITNDYYNASNTTTSNFSYELIKGSYDFSTLPADFALNEFTLDLVAVVTPYLQTYYDTHYTTNSIQFYFRDEDTNALITENVTVELISDLIAYSYWTDNGTLFVDLISPTEYNIRYSADGYGERNYFFTMTDYSFNNITLYLANETDFTEVTINVFDTLQNPLEAARVKILKYDAATNSYEIVSVKETNFAGQIKELLAVGTEYYKFIVEYDDEVVLTTTASYIYSSEITLYANLLTGGFDELFRLTGLYGVIGYGSGNAYFTWNDEDGVVSQGCLYAYLQTDAGFVANGSVCASGAADTIYLPVTNTSGLTYLLKGYVDKNGYTIYLTNYWLSFKDELDTGRNGLILGFILLAVFVFVGYWRLEAAVFMGGFGFIIMVFVGVININIGIAIGMFVLSIIGAFIISNKKGGAV